MSDRTEPTGLKQHDEITLEGLWCTEDFPEVLPYDQRPWWRKAWWLAKTEIRWALDWVDGLLGAIVEKMP